MRKYTGHNKSMVHVKSSTSCMWLVCLRNGNLWEILNFKIWYIIWGTKIGTIQSIVIINICP